MLSISLPLLSIESTGGGKGGEMGLRSDFNGMNGSSFGYKTTGSVTSRKGPGLFGPFDILSSFQVAGQATKPSRVRGDFPNRDSLRDFVQFFHQLGKQRGS